VKEPTVNERRGVPVTVTDSEKATVNVGVSAGLYVLLLGAVTELINGTVRSITIVEEKRELAAGPLLLVTVPYTEFAITCGFKVPSEQLLTVRVKLVPELALTEKLHPVADPALLKSEFATVSTFCEKVIEKVMLEFVLVGVDWAVVKEVTAGLFK